MLTSLSSSVSRFHCVCLRGGLDSAKTINNSETDVAVLFCLLPLFLGIFFHASVSLIPPGRNDSLYNNDCLQSEGTGLDFTEHYEKLSSHCRVFAPVCACAPNDIQNSPALLKKVVGTKTIPCS